MLKELVEEESEFVIKQSINLRNPFEYTYYMIFKYLPFGRDSFNFVSIKPLTQQTLENTLIFCDEHNINFVIKEEEVEETDGLINYMGYSIKSFYISLDLSHFDKIVR